MTFVSVFVLKGQIALVINRSRLIDRGCKRLGRRPFEKFYDWGSMARRWSRQSAGCITFFVDYEYKEDLIYRPDFTISGLPEAVKLIIAGDAGAPFQKAIKNQKL